MILVRTLAKFAACFAVASIEAQKSSMVYSAVPVDWKRVSSSSSFHE